MNNLKKLRKEKGLLQDDVAKYLGLTRPAYSHYETGRRVPDAAMLEKLADLFHVTTDDILGRTENIGREIQEVPNLHPEEEVLIPLVATMQCGPGTAGEPFTFIKPIPIPASYVRRWGENLKAIVATGKSMSPTIIPGDILVCRPGSAWEDGNVVSVNVDDNDMVKRIFRTKDGGIDLVSDNPEFETLHFAPEETEYVHVLGRVMIPIPKEL